METVLTPYSNISEVLPEILFDATEVRQSVTNAKNANTFLQTLTTATFTGSHEDPPCCGICCEDYVDDLGKVIAQLPCGHCYHSMCISSWLSPTRHPSQNTCPLCRAVLFEIIRYVPSREEIRDGVALMRARSGGPIGDIEALAGLSGEDRRRANARRAAGEWMRMFLTIFALCCVGQFIVLVFSGDLKGVLEFAVRS